MKNRRRLPLIAALVTFGVLLAAGAALADTYLKVEQKGADSTTFKQGDNCAAERVEFGLSDAEALWHFVLNQTDEVNSGEITAFFQSAGQIGPQVYFAQNGPTLHWYLITPTNDILNDAFTTADDTELLLSHVCAGAEKAEPEITTLASGDGSAGDSLYDTATLTGGFTPPSGTPGTVTFTLYGPDDTDCSNVIYTDTVDVTWAADGTGSAQSTDGGNPADGRITTPEGLAVRRHRCRVRRPPEHTLRPASRGQPGLTSSARDAGSSPSRSCSPSRACSSSS